MHRQNLLSKLKSYPDSPVRDRFEEFVKTHEDCFLRSLQMGHITGSAWVVNSSATHVALVHHKRLGIWVQPGGHADGNPDTLEVAMTEAREETGLHDLRVISPNIFDLDIHVIPGNSKEPQHEHFDVRYAFETTGDESLIVSEESSDVKWVGLEELEKYTKEESVLRMREKMIVGAGR